MREKSESRIRVFGVGIILSLSAYSTLLIFDLLLLSLLIWLCHRKFGLLIGVIACVPTFDLEIGGNTYRSILLLTILILVFKSVKLSNQQIRNFTLCLIAFLPLYVSSFLGEYTNSTLVAFQFLLLGIGSYLLVSIVADDKPMDDFLNDFLIGIILVGVINSIFAFLQILRLSDDAVLGNLYHDRPSGLYLEPDFLGFFSAISLVALHYVRKKSLTLLTLFPLLFSLITSLARAAWISLCVFLIFYVFFKEGISKSIIRLLSLIFVSFTFFVLIIDFLPKSQVGVVQERLQSISVQKSTDSARLARIRQWEGLNQLAANSPWYGAGLTASGRVLMQGAIANQKTTNNVGSNWILSLWAEAKYLAIPYFLYIFRAVLITRKSPLQPILLVIFINSCFTNMLWYTITPVMLGMSYNFFSNFAKSSQKLPT